MNFLQKTTELGSKQRLWFLGFAALLAVGYDILFWDKSLGINFAIFVVVYLVGFLTLCYKYSLFAQKKALFLLAPILVMTVDTQLYSNTMIHYWVPLFILAQLFILTGWLPAKNPAGVLFAIRRIPLIRNFDLAIAQWGNIIRDLSADNGTGSRAVARRIFIGVALALPILFFFGALFYSADQVFADWINKIDIEMVDLWRVIRTIGLSLLIGGIFYEVARSGYGFTQNNIQREIKESDPIIVSVILILINILFGVFVFIQFKYLFGNIAYISENDLTYAEYARKGFFELLVVSGFATIIAQAVYRGYKHLKSMPVLYVTSLFLLIQTSIVAASAFTRLNLYQDAYGFTVLRLYTEWFILFLFGIFVVIGYGIISNMEFRKNFLVLWVYGILSLTVVVSMNVDYTISERNILQHQKKHKSLDLAYITRLSDDVYPSITRYIQTEEGWRTLGYRSAQEMIEGVDTGVVEPGDWTPRDERLYDLARLYTHDITDTQWQSYHAGRMYIQKRTGLHTLPEKIQQELQRAKNTSETDRVRVDTYITTDEPTVEDLSNQTVQ